jgi:CHAT domain-containing protein
MHVKELKRAIRMLVKATLFTGMLTCAHLGQAQPLDLSDSDVPIRLPIRKLAVGSSISGSTRSGEPATFTFRLTKGERSTISVEQIDSDLSCSISVASTEAPIVSVDRMARVGGTEKIEFIAESGGTYTLSIRPKYRKPSTVRYSVSISTSALISSKEQTAFEIDKLITRAKTAREQGLPKSAVDLADLAVSKAREIFGLTPEFARVINEAAMFIYWNGETRRFRTVAAEAWAIMEKLPEGDSDRLLALENIAFAMRMTGDAARSEELTNALLRLRSEQFGEDHPSIAPVLGELAALKRGKGDYVAATNLTRRSLDIRERWYGVDNIEVVQSLQNMASIAYAMGDDEGFLRVTERVLSIRRKTLPAGHPDIARSLMDIGNLRTDLHDFDTAETLLKESLAIREKAFGYDHPMTVLSRFSLASLYHQRGELSKAKVVFDEIWDLLPQIESRIARTQATLILQGLGGFYLAIGEFERSEMMLRKALDVRIGNQGAESLDSGRSYEDLARLYGKMGRISDALRYQYRANEIAEKNLQTLLQHGTEQQKLNLIQGIASGLNQSVSLHADIAPSSEEAKMLAVETIINRKGRVLDTMLAAQAKLNASSAEAEKNKVRLAELNSTLSREMLGRAAVERSAEWKSRIEELIRERRDIYKNVSDLGDAAAAGHIGLDEVRAAIPPDAALLEFKVYSPFGTSTRFGQQEIIAYIIRREGEIGWAKIGLVSEVEGLVERFRKGVRDPNSDASTIAAELSRRIALPIVARSGDVKRLIVAPDGPLNLVPFQALVGSDGRYLIERFTVSYVTSGRDLVRSGATEAGIGEAEVFADPDFGMPPARNQVKTALQDFFQPLRATQREARLISETFSGVRVHLRAESSEKDLKAVSRPKLLHIATHGFFLADDSNQGSEPHGSFWKPEFQLFRSGLVLANVNSQPVKGDDGVLTALEASALDLRGTKLVVLSACDTGVGSVKNGEGVYGLRRAFTIAGAEALVMSLWQVSDQATLELMAGYYKNLKNGLGRADSLRMIQVEMLKKPARKHPYYWASFIHAGAWTPLDAGQ